MTITPEEIALVSVDDELAAEWSTRLDARQQALDAYAGHVSAALARFARSMDEWSREFSAAWGPAMRHLHDLFAEAPRPSRKPGRGRRAPSNRRRRLARRALLNGAGR